MTWASSEVLSVFTFLLPGFVAAAIYYLLTSHPKPSAFERVIQALIFTAIVQTVVASLPSSVRPLEISLGADISWDPVWPVGFAIVVGLAVAIAANYDTAHRVLRTLRLTRETSYPSPWYGALFRNTDRYVVLHLTGGRRLYGWAEEWPNDPTRGHFRVIEGEWLRDGEGEAGSAAPGDSGQDAQTDIEILVAAPDVEMVEFVQPLKPRSE